MFAGLWERRKCVITVAAESRGNDAATNAELDTLVHVQCQLTHTNVLPTYSMHVGPLECLKASASFRAARCMTLVQQFANGGSLGDALASGALRAPRMTKRWGPIMSLLKGVVAGMSYLHRSRVCLGDLSPSRIFLQVRSCFKSQNFHLA
jgi:serine/threonine protein kinase